VPGTRYLDLVLGIRYLVPEHVFGKSERLFGASEHLFVFGVDTVRDQLCLKVWSKILHSDEKGTRKTAVAYVLWSRWWMQIVGLVGGVVTPILTFIQRFDPDLCHCGLATQFTDCWFVS
jgi:hypothetical protein